MQALIMSLRNSILAVAVLAVAGFAAFYPQPDPKEKEQFIMQAVMTALDRMHFSPVDIDDAFSKKLFEEYLEEIDPGKRFLTQPDITSMRAHETLLDDEIKLGDLSFFNLSLELMDAGYDKARKYYKKHIDTEFDFSVEEQYELDEKKRPWPADDQALEDYWRRTLKYEILIRYEQNIKKEDNEDTSREELIADARKQVKKIFDDWFDRMDDIRREDRFETYINTITHRFDPHSDYYNPKDKEDFDIRMSGRLEGIGARLQTDGEYTKVVSIVPGGPAWKQKDLEVNDLISKVKQENEEPVDVTGMRIDDVVKLIRGPKGTKVTLTVKKVDGTHSDITIERDEVIIDEGFAKSLILSLKDRPGTIGYINLPGFYADFEGKGSPNSAADIKKELLKLKAEHVDGIILDLRNNGGGSLREVVDMSGLFIEKGPVVQVMNRGRDKPYVYEDKDASVTYDGPLIVLVNRFSASASEILTAALQDYNRAVIVGTNSTFGKGTVQRFFDMDRLITSVPSDLKPLGEIKVTTQKYYRIDGGSVQLQGVTPDIVLPDSYHYLRTGEKDYKNAMEWTEIAPLKYNQQVWKPKNIELLRKKSAERLQGDTLFSMVLENAERMKRLKEETTIPMAIDEYVAVIEHRETEAKRFNNLGKVDMENLTARNPEIDMDYINSDSSRIARNDNWLKTVKRDYQLNEGLQIMHDLLGTDPALTKKRD
jgi:carboxyl-terminal processing protease